MARDSSEADRARLVAMTPLGRIATPEEIASVVAFLASPRRGIHDRIGRLRERRPSNGLSDKGRGHQLVAMIRRL